MKNAPTPKRPTPLPKRERVVRGFARFEWLALKLRAADKPTRYAANPDGRAERRDRNLSRRLWRRRDAHSARDAAQVLVERRRAARAARRAAA